VGLGGTAGGEEGDDEEEEEDAKVGGGGRHGIGRGKRAGDGRVVGRETAELAAVVVTGGPWFRGRWARGEFLTRSGRVSFGFRFVFFGGGRGCLPPSWRREAPSVHGSGRGVPLEDPVGTLVVVEGEGLKEALAQGRQVREALPRAYSLLGCR
jgi:hypothetical protein